MVVKDWKKTSYAHRVSYAKPFSYARVDIYHIRWPGDKYWQVVVTPEKGKLSTKRFKTKLQAEAYAKEYTSKH